MKYSAFLIIFIQTCYLIGQQTPIGYVWEERQQAEFLLNRSDTFFHSGFFPFTYACHLKDSAISENLYGIRYQHRKKWDNFFHHTIVQVKDSDFFLHIIPIFNVRYTFDSSINKFAENTRGIFIYGQLSNCFSFVSGATETQAFFPAYINDYHQNNLVIPGNGRIRHFNQTGFDYSKAFGHIVYTPNKHWNVVLGHAKQFIGYGYRSVLLSDAPYEYPLLRISFQTKRLHYQVMYASFQSATPYEDRTKVHSRTFSSIHYLNYLFTKNWQVAIFENTLFSPMSKRNNRPSEEYYLPVLFIPTVIYGLNNRRNVMLGFQTQWSPLSRLKLYGQWAFDDYSKTDSLRKKLAWQYGIKINEPFGIKRLFLLAEYNQALPYTYASNEPYSTFSQHNEPIAHILGNRFNEYVAALSYQYRIFFARIKYHKAIYCPTKKRLTVSQSDPLQTIIQYRFEVGIKIHQPSRLELHAGYHYRKDSSLSALAYFYISLSTRLFNFYDDF